jgi:cytidylate kinase
MSLAQQSHRYIAHGNSLPLPCSSWTIPYALPPTGITAKSYQVSQSRSIVVNGDLGAGKSRISSELARRLHLPHVAMGDVHREMALNRQKTIDQLNDHAGRDKAVDNYVDNLQRELARSNEPKVVDSRLGWYFFPGAFKVHLLVDPSIGAKRAMSRPSNSVESYSSAEEAEIRLRARSNSEHTRFLATYGVDKYKLRNYDMVCDTSQTAIDDIVAVIIDGFNGLLATEILEKSPPLLLLDPTRIYPTESIQVLRDLWDSKFAETVNRLGVRSLEPIDVGYAERFFYLVNGSRRLSAAIQAGFQLVPARLVAEQTETVVAGWSATQYFRSEVSLTKVYDWEAAHHIELPLPPHVLQQGQAAILRAPQ